MDHTLSAVLRTGLETYLRAARRSGRTALTLRSARPGDTIVCAAFAVETTRRQLRALGVDQAVKVVALDPSNPDSARFHQTGTGRLLFDHTAIEAHYQYALQMADKTLERLMRTSPPPRSKRPPGEVPPVFEALWDRAREQPALNATLRHLFASREEIRADRAGIPLVDALAIIQALAPEKKSATAYDHGGAQWTPPTPGEDEGDGWL